MLYVAGGHSASRVSNEKLDVAASPFGPQTKHSLLGRTFFKRVQGIGNQVEQDLLDLDIINDNAEVIGDRQFDIDSAMQDARFCE